MFAHATAILLCLTSVLACASCASPTQPDGIAQLTTVLSRCADSRHSSLIASDESRTSRGATSQPVRLQVIRDEVARTAVCGGHVRVTVFSGSVVGQVVFDGDLTTVGATETSRLRKVPKLVDQTMATIGRRLPPARASLPGDGTDITGQYEVAAEYFAQQSPSGRATRVFSVLTDGISTVPAEVANPGLTVARAQQLAETETPAKIPGVNVRMIGVGRTADGEQLPSSYVDAVKTFQSAVCAKTDAASCLIVTDAGAGAK
ncbi:hypothetical protein GOPIP_081_00460 [Gordonia polyisoprenivorans NBRC 16320 = JCM 10675]|nr:hypothetical protein GOPIP_081_00460 [Gordonia polyisoprenivorans NBRC 16320 = JCM 10675]